MTRRKKTYLPEVRNWWEWTYAEIIAASEATFGKRDKPPTDDSYRLAYLEAQRAEIERQQAAEEYERTRPARELAQREAAKVEAARPKQGDLFA